MVRRCDADVLVAALALSLSAGGVPLRAAAPGERQAPPERPRVRADRHGGVRRRSLLADHRGLCEGGAEGSVRAHPCAQRRTGGRATARAADTLVSQSLVVGGGHCTPGDQRARGAKTTRRPPRSPKRSCSAAGSWWRARTPQGGCRSCCSATTTPTRQGCSGCPLRLPIRRTASTTMLSPGRQPSTRRGAAPRWHAGIDSASDRARPSNCACGWCGRRLAIGDPWAVPVLSFPRQREPRVLKNCWIRACAGVTAVIDSLVRT